MNFSTIMVAYLMVYFATIIYFVVLGCYMLFHQDSTHSTNGELVAKQRMTRTMGVTMFVVALEWFVYLPPVLAGLQPNDPIYDVFTLAMIMLLTPAIFCVMFAVVQRKVNNVRWICGLGTPFLLLAVWQLVTPPEFKIPLYLGASLSVASYIFLLVRFAKEYRIYVRRIRSEYSDTTGRDIAWSWISFSGFAVQGILFVVYEMFWSYTLESLYHLFTILNFGYLCFCISRQRTIDVEVVNDDGALCYDNDGSTSSPTNENENQSKNERALYADIEQKLRTLCEDRLLFITPDITLETLALHLGTNRTYMGMYFRERNITFYQYINALRIEYATRLMQENPDMPISEVCSRSGFRSQPTFRKAFQEVMGCLPSEVRAPKTLPRSSSARLRSAEEQEPSKAGSIE